MDGEEGYKRGEGYEVCGGGLAGKNGVLRMGRVMVLFLYMYTHAHLIHTYILTRTQQRCFKNISYIAASLRQED